MDTFFMFLKLVHANLKRLKSYIVSILTSVLLLLVSCGAIGYFISENLYKKENTTKITLAYYLPQDEDLSYNLIGLSFFENLESVKDTAQLVQVSTIYEGKAMVETGAAEYFVIVPENFFSGIMYGDNPPIEIIIKENSSTTAHVINELFLSYARYLGVAQASVYSALDILHENKLPTEAVGQIQDRVNATFLDRALNKDNYSVTVSAINQNEISLLNHYLASATMISLFFVAVIFMPLLKGYNKGITQELHSRKINILHIFTCNLFTCILALYIAYLPCYIGLSIFSKNLNIAGLITIIPILLIMSVLIVTIAFLAKNVFSANLVLLCTIIIIAYIGGGLLPDAFLPSAVRTLSEYMPGKYMIDTIAKGIFL